jgi:hypothetical protein
MPYQLATPLSTLLIRGEGATETRLFFFPHAVKRTHPQISAHTINRAREPALCDENTLKQFYSNTFF